MVTTTARSTRAAVVLLAWLVAPACAGRINPNLTPPQQEQQALRELQRTAGVTERIGHAMLALQNLEIALFQQGRIPRDTHIEAQTYFKLTAQFVIDALERAKDVSKPAADRRSGILDALKRIDEIQVGVIDRIPDQDVRSRLGLVLMTIQTLLMTWSMVT